MKPRALTWVLATACAMAACTPVLDWRDARPDGAGLMALFPCRPAGQVRRLALAGTTVEMTLYACSAGDATYAVGFADIGETQQVTGMLAALSAAAARNIGSTGSTEPAPLHVDGMTPNPMAGRWAFSGRRADGRHVQMQVGLFARGTRVFQASMVGTRLNADAIETFFGALRLQT